MIALPIEPRRQRLATATSLDYLQSHGTPTTPQDLLSHACVHGQFANGKLIAWEFEREGQSLGVAPPGPLRVRPGAPLDLEVQAAPAGLGIAYLFEDWLKPHFEAGTLAPILEPWWQSFPGPFLYYPGRRYLPSPLHAFVDFIKSQYAAQPYRERLPPCIIPEEGSFASPFAVKIVALMTSNFNDCNRSRSQRPPTLA